MHVTFDPYNIEETLTAGVQANMKSTKVQNPRRYGGARNA